jgi:prepilin-type N-terminal cleavage/methylation domain-containing protein
MGTLFPFFITEALMKRSRRAGFTMLELIVVIAILGIVLGLILAAIMRVREAGTRIESTNNLKQIMLAVHNYTKDRRGQLPTIDGMGPNWNQSLPKALLPYLEQGGKGNRGILNYLSPADPTYGQALHVNQIKVSSYPANALVFRYGNRFPQSIVDGTSTTIGFAEHYAICNGVPFGINVLHPGLGNWPHRATFADALDIGPRIPPPKLTFQVTPRTSACKPGIAQTPHPGGMLVAMMDGSVRQISPGISSATYWGAVTPAGNEALNDDW